MARSSREALVDARAARVARRIAMGVLTPDRGGTEGRGLDPQQHLLETALRSRSARRIRTWVRRMEPVFVRVPRWSRPTGFFEDIALDLAVGEPAVGCRTVSCRPLRHRGTGEAWSFLLQLFGQLGMGGRLVDGSATAADRKGFRWGLQQALEDAHRHSRHRLAVLMVGIEHVEVEVLSDLVDEWSAYRHRHPEGVRVVVLLAGAEQPRWLDLPGLQVTELEDYSEAETIAAIVQRCGPLPPAQLRLLSRFTGGIPELVEAVVEAVGDRRDRLDVDRLLAGLGPVGDQVRGAIDRVAVRGELLDRLEMLADGHPHTEWLDTDTPLIDAGLVRRVRGHGLPHVRMRAQAFSAMVA